MREETLRDTVLLSEFEHEGLEEANEPGGAPEFEQIFAEHHDAVVPPRAEVSRPARGCRGCGAGGVHEGVAEPPSFNGDSSVKTWVYRIANQLLHRLRQEALAPPRRVEPRPDDGHRGGQVLSLVSECVDAEGMLLAEEKVAHLRSAITRLKPT